MKYISLQENGIFKEDYLMKIIATNNAPAAIGPYSQGIVSMIPKRRHPALLPAGWRCFCVCIKSPQPAHPYSDIL